METVDRDPQLWRMAQDRARFKSHLFTYFWVNALLWVIWLLTDQHHFRGIPWPIWSTVFWGLSLVFRGVNVYSGNKTQLQEREYERLLRQREGR